MLFFSKVFSFQLLFSYYMCVKTQKRLNLDLAFLLAFIKNTWHGIYIKDGLFWFSSQ